MRSTRLSNFTMWYTFTQLVINNPRTVACIGTVALGVAAPQLIAVPVLGLAGFGAEGIAAGLFPPPTKDLKMKNKKKKKS